MKKVLALVAITCTALLNAHGSSIYTLFNIPTGSSNVGTFSIGAAGLSSISQLSLAGGYQRSYAYRSFTPSVTGSYTLGMTYAPFDAVMILYSGQSSFPANPATGALALNDDGSWDQWIDPDTFDVSYFFGTQTVNPSAAGGYPEWMPLLQNQSMTAGTDYLVAITTWGTSYDPIPLPASFFVVGPGAVKLDGAAGVSAIPEPSTYALLALSAAGLGAHILRRRHK